MSLSRACLSLEPGLAGAECGLLAVDYLQLLEDIGDVVGNRLWAQGQEPSDFGVGGTLHHEVQHLTLAVGESRERFSGNSRTVGGEEVSEARGDARSEDRTAAPHRAYGAEHVILFVVLEDVSSRARAHGGEDRGVVLEHGDDEDADTRVCREHAPGGLYAAQPRHL